ncbi:tafazzin [Talaromyces proteolyticus]|uniref:Tafazzin n=1 Tax=Talaromyces proteolyticus TaxID=1131652 RepID=A0AAD4PS00_9EURO|nr:tafazzin [Talaromyces proteolyticus]KAH8690145.1 tafazzin [Talaromyces proteolyticus]
MPLGATADRPSAWWRAGSSLTMFEIGALCRGFLLGLNKLEVNGLESFTELLDSRRDPSKRTRGLITVSNHISVMDDPLMWGALPMKYHFNLPSFNRRWGFGSHDICFATRPGATFFTLGQVLPTHRLAYSPYGGLFQSTMTQGVRLLSKGPFPADPHFAKIDMQRWSLRSVCVDPFSELPTAYTTTGEDATISPSSYACNSYSWIHIFPEGKIHQSPKKIMRYFKWGVSRLILESSECPDVVPIWLEGTDDVMHEDRKFPRFLPRPFNSVSITFGKKADTEAVFGDLRRRWKELKAKAEKTNPAVAQLPLGVLSEELMFDKEAVELRKECTKKVRDLVLEVRRSRGLPDEDPKASLAETWILEGPKREGKMEDESWYTPYASIKPTNTAHPSLQSSSNARHGPSGSSPSGGRSVNDLIHHLRRTQVSPTGEGSSSPSRSTTPRTLHPSIRNILDVPETPPPRPRTNVRQLGGRFRRTPGPPPPSSWLNNNQPHNSTIDRRGGVSVGYDQVLYRLERLPGVVFPPKDSLQHVVLKSMATHWMWHLDYDGEFLLELPERMKILLLSYIGIYSRDVHPKFRAHGLSNLFAIPEDGVYNVKDITRLDLGAALGTWTSLKSLFNQLLTPSPVKDNTDNQKEEVIPASWDEAVDAEADIDPLVVPSPLSVKSLSHVLRFPNLKYLSLAHPDPASSNWGSLLNLLSHIPALTHLSLAQWPVPTLTPNSIHTRVRHPTIRSLTFAAGGTDTYTAEENSWVEAVSILRRLSRATYCLKWLDLEGCGEWLGALCWDGHVSDGDEPYHAPWPEWNGSWRDIEWVGLGPGWIPSSQGIENNDELQNPIVPLAASIHANTNHQQNPRPAADPDDLTSVLTEQELREAEMARERQRRVNEWKAYEDVLRKARKVEKHVHRIRRDGAGKWIHFSFGGEGREERRIIERVLEDIDKI